MLFSGWWPIMWRKVSITLVILFVGYAAAGFLILPVFFKSLAQDRLTQAMHREVTIRDIDINPFALSVKVKGLAVSENRDEAPVASFDELFVNLQIRSLFRKALIVREIRLEKPCLVITRTALNTYNFSDLAGDRGSSGKPLLFALGNIRITGGCLEFRDRVTDTRHLTTGIAVAVPFVSNIDEYVETFVQPSLAAVVNGTAFSLTGQTKPFADSLETSMDIDLKGLSLPFYMGYVPRDLKIAVQSGSLDLRGKVSYIQSRGRKPDIVVLGDLSLKDFSLLDQEGLPLMALPYARLILAPSRLSDRTVALSDVQIDAPRLHVRRDASGALDWAGLLARDVRERDGDRTGAEDQPVGRTMAGPAPADTPLADESFNLDVNALSISKGAVEFTDASNTNPAKLVWSEVELQAQDLSTRPDAQGNIRFASRLNRTGSVSAAADLTLNPLLCRVRMDVDGLEIGWVQPYFADKVQLVVTRGHLSAEGDVSLGKTPDNTIKASFAGSARIGDFASVDKRHADDFVKWRTLAIDDISLVSDPGSLEIGGVRIEDAFSQIIVHKDGSLNIKNAFQTGKDTGQAPVESQGQAFDQIRIDRVVLQNGDVSFLDRSVVPSFSADLGELWGSVTGLSSERVQPAALDFSGKLNYSTPLKITGRVNPFAEDIYLDLRTNVQDMDLSALTPYSGRYLGYAIERGKLSLDLAYTIDRKELDASNDILIDQLTFGRSVESEDAVKLPVKLAVSLLKDTKGLIDLRLPVKGRTDDPEFSVAGIILTMITNTISKAATSPFSLLESIYPGASELSVVEFEPGRAKLPKGAVERLGVLIKILTDKPSLKIDIQGFADREKDRTGLADVLFEKKLKAEKLKIMARNATAARTLDEVIILPEEYGRYLKMAYNAADFSKPRNFIGLPLSLEAHEMEKLIRENIEVTDSDLRLLALNRAQQVKASLMGMQVIDPARIYLVEKNNLSPDEKPGKSKSRAEITLK